MSKVSRADWAATTPWSGVTNKPAIPGAGVTDIGQLTGNGYASGQYPRYNAATKRFVPATLPPPSPPAPTPGGTTIIVYWDVPNLHAWQSAWEEFTFPGAFIGAPVAVGPPFPNEFVTVFASVVSNDTVRITVTNLNLTDVDLGNGSWSLRI